MQRFCMKHWCACPPSGAQLLALHRLPMAQPVFWEPPRRHADRQQLWHGDSGQANPVHPVHLEHQPGSRPLGLRRVSSGGRLESCSAALRVPWRQPSLTLCECLLAAAVMSRRSTNRGCGTQAGFKLTVPLRPNTWCELGSSKLAIQGHSGGTFTRHPRRHSMSLSHHFSQIPTSLCCCAVLQTIC